GPPDDVGAHDADGGIEEPQHETGEPRVRAEVAVKPVLTHAVLGVRKRVKRQEAAPHEREDRREAKPGAPQIESLHPAQLSWRRWASRSRRPPFTVLSRTARRHNPVRRVRGRYRAVTSTTRKPRSGAGLAGTIVAL